jgi:competence CoiA-like predicted nuclease
MLFATVNGEKIEAIPKTKGICPLCELEVFSKCGEINVWHWAHQKDESCDSWYEPETEWHKNWKLIFGKEYCEIVLSKEGVRHIADIQTKDGIIIELQNSPIQKPIIRSRENFYGDRMLWVINGVHFKNNFTISSSPIINDKDILLHFKYYQFKYDNADKNEGDTTFLRKNELFFSWNWSRKSWSDVQRNIFIDFGGESLFWVTDGMGTNRGKGRLIKKEGFIKKYGGNIELLRTLIEKSD